MTRLNHRVRNLECRLAPSNLVPSWNDCFAQVNELAQKRLSPTDRSLFQDAFAIRSTLGEVALNDQQRNVWTRWSEAFAAVQSGLHLPYAVEADDRWL